MTQQPILVLGATGTTGRRVAALLRASGRSVRGASRKSEVPFDWSSPQTWEAALSGVSQMYLMVPDGVPVDPSFVRQAVSSGVRQIVLLSSMAIETMGDTRLMDAEETVRSSGADWTIPRANWFDQNFDEGFLRDAVMAGEVALPLGDLRQAFVDAGDVAAMAFTALTQDGHSGQTYDVMGPRALSFGEAVEIISEAAGRPVRFDGGPRRQSRFRRSPAAGRRRAQRGGPPGDRPRAERLRDLCRRGRRRWRLAVIRARSVGNGCSPRMTRHFFRRRLGGTVPDA